MENKEEEEKGGCCAKGRCCGGKALAAIGLLAIGAFGGYFCGRQCSVKSAPAAVEAPAPVK